MLESAREQCAQAGARVDVLHMDVRLAECLALEGRAAEALVACDAALETVGSLDGVFSILPYLLRIRGWALLTLGQRDEARQVLKAALGQAHDTKADYEIALTADIVAQVARADGDEAEATELESVRDSIFGELGVTGPETILLPVGRAATTEPLPLTHRSR